MSDNYLQPSMAHGQSEQKSLQASYRNPTVLERLRAQREMLAAKLAETDSAISGLESNPEIERVLAAINRAL